MNTNAKKTILVVEDELMLLEAIVKKLQIHDFSVLSATGADHAIKILSGGGVVPDVIWLDFYLKDRNADELIKEIKQNPAWANIPIMVVSNSISEETAHGLYALGVKKYVLKANYELNQLVDMVNELCSSQ
jgi:chemosensory pili system protein ChpA (sensor histidine kinase/response regulator)